MTDEFKADMRSQMRRQMRELPESTRHEASAAACRRLVQLEAFRHRIRDRLAGLGAPYGLGAAEVFARISNL